VVNVAVAEAKAKLAEVVKVVLVENDEVLLKNRKNQKNLAKAANQK
jgi:hypothetical protein